MRVPFPLALLTSALVALVLASSLALGQAVDGPGTRFDDELLSNLEGRWTIVRQIRGEVVKNTLEARWVLAHQFLELQMKDVAEPPQYEAIVLIGYVHATGEYVAHWTDSFGGKYSAIGKGRRRGKSIEFRFEYDDGPFFNTFTWDADARRWTFRLESQKPDGSRELFALDTAERR